MYSSLDVIDIAAKDPKTGTPLHVQTDHRSPEEISAEPELSTIFALTRVLNAKRPRDGVVAEVRYGAMQRPTDALREAIASAGGVVDFNGALLPWTGPQRAPADLADEAFRLLAQRTSEEYGIALDEAGLRALEQLAWMERPSRDRESGEEISYWTWVAKLAAVAGEVLRAKHGGRWEPPPQPMGVIPFAFATGGAFTNPCGKAEKFLESGDRESLTQLLRMAEDSTVDKSDRPVMPTFKPGDWDGREVTLCRPLLANSQKQEPRLPIVAFGEDMPSSFGIFNRDPKREAELPKIEAQAFANLARVEVNVEDIELPGLKILAVGGGYFAAEKLLDRAFMKAMQKRLGAEMLMAAVPRKGMLLIANAMSSAEATFKFSLIAQKRFEDPNGGGPSISPIPLLVRDGEVQGFAQATEKPAPEKKKGFFSRLFN